MIRLTRYDGTQFVVNCEIIQYVESTPDTIVTLTTSDKIMVRESVDEIIESVVAFRKRIFQGLLELKRDDSMGYVE